MSKEITGELPRELKPDEKEFLKCLKKQVARNWITIADAKQIFGVYVGRYMGA